MDSAAKPATNTWIVTSDERIKENIINADIDRCYDIVKNLPLKRFNWKYYDDKTVPDKSMLGWIAQDVKEIFPKAVNITPFTIKEEIKENDIIIQEKEVIEDCLNLNADQINKALYGTVQKLQNIVENQQLTINSLLSRIEQLENK